MRQTVERLDLPQCLRSVLSGQAVHGNCFVVVEPGAVVTMASPFGALVLVWGEGPETWTDGEAAGAGHAVVRSLLGF